MRRRRAWGWGLRRILPQSIPGKSMSAVYWRGGDDMIERTLYRPQYFDKIVAWGGGDAGFLNPFAKQRGPELKAQLVRAAIAAIEAVREVDPRARICHAEPIIHIAVDPDYPEEAAAAEGYRMSQFQAWDMLSGRICPELGGRPEYLDLLGVNYYSNNQWIHQDPNTPASRRRPRSGAPSRPAPRARRRSASDRRGG